MGRALRVLLVEDSEVDQKLIERELARGFDLTLERVETREAMEAALDRASWDVVLSDYMLPRFDAPAAHRVLVERAMDVPFIIVSGTVGEETAVEAMRLGVQDYVLKGKLARLVPAIERELREREGREARRRAEEQLRQMQKVEMVGRLAGGIAHDFNNVLAVILSYTDLLASEPGLSPEWAEDLAEIRLAAERATTLTRQLLAFSRQQAVAPRAVDPNDVIAGVEKMLRRVIGENVLFEIECAKDLGRVRIDPGQLEQVFVNLIVNARDAMPHGGRLEIRTENAGPNVAVSVIDSGEGMDAATRARIFEPFFTTKEPGKGTGLGLSTVLSIVEQAGGSIQVESERQRGTRFDILLPRVMEASSAETKSAPPSASLRGSETILIAEDDPQLRSVARQVLARQGYRILEASSAARARELHANERQLALLVTDVILPDGSGVDLSNELRDVQPQLRVLFVSGYTSDAATRRAMEAQPRRFLEKPYTAAALSQRVREALDAPAQ